MTRSSLLLLGLILLGAASAQAQLRGYGTSDEFGSAVEDYYRGRGSGNANAAAPPDTPVLGRGLVVGEDDAWAPVVRA